MKIVCTSGYFDPIHAGHLECLQKARALGDKLIVIINTDEQAVMKKGFVLMPLEQRIAILRALPFVDAVIVAVDTDGSVCKSIESVRPHIFAKGGDRFSNEIPEKQVCDRLGVEIVDGLGDKIFSSRNVVRELISNVEKVPQEYLEGL